jgi:cathepsin L
MRTTLFVVLALCLVGAAFCLPSEQEYQFLFTKWMKHHQRSYAALEFQQRFGIWKANFDYIHAHNAKNLSFTMSVNQFADLTNREFNSLYKGVKINKVPMLTHTVVPAPGLPASVDWRNKGVVTQVKNQGQCGSCWSFSSTGSIEGQHAISTGSLVSLSEQNLVDCSTAQGNQGCNGGLMDQAFQYVIQNNGIDTEASYPYTATGPNQCQFSASNVGATIQSYKDIDSGSESGLQQAVGTVGPVSVAIDASHNSFQFYSGGVYYEPDCSSSSLDHGVLSVGYGNYQGQDYWLVKNSWGASWGLSGYIMMARNKNNNCGIATAASYPCVNAC